MSRYAGDQVRWEIAVYDAVLMRPRVVVVEVVETRVVIIPPPGEGFVLPPDSTQPFCDAVQLAHAVAERRRRG